MAEVVSRPCAGLFESVCSTQFKKCKFRFKWTINDFRFYCDASRENFVSSTFSDGTDDGLKWKLELEPERFRGLKEDDGYLWFLKLHLVSSNVTSFLARCKFSVVTANLQEVNEHKHNFEFGEKQKILYINQFIKERDFVKKEAELLPDDGLTILCEIVVSISNENISRELTIPACHVPDNLGLALLENAQFSDVTINAGGKEFLAHKAVLATRSCVFKAMFQHDTKESRTNHIEIPDVDCEIFEKMLHFIYTDQFSDLHKVTDLMFLFRVADKYELERLKLRCQEALSRNLSEQNAVQCYIVAHQVKAENLKVLIKSFIIANATDVSRTPGFSSLVQIHPELVVEALSSISY